VPDSQSPGVSSAAFSSELVKLLLQVAWADHDVAPQEAEALLRYARQNGLSRAELDALGAMLTGRAPLTPPNLGLLKQRRSEVLRAVKSLLVSDVHVAEEEEEILAQISTLLA
jgi:uncharacterized tellurite resistance protein B-like protein